MGLPAKKDDRLYLYRDYRVWPDDERRELIDGVAWNMSPAPSMAHQALSVELDHAIRSSLAKCERRVFAAPFDVLLPESLGQAEDDVPNVVQPDLAVFCDPSRLRPFGCVGAPDWVIEILLRARLCAGRKRAVSRSRAVRGRGHDPVRRLAGVRAAPGRGVRGDPGPDPLPRACALGPLSRGLLPR